MPITEKVEFSGHLEVGDVVPEKMKLRGLENLLLEEQRVTRTTLDAVKATVIKDMQAELGEELISQFGFHNLEWWRLGPKEIPCNDLAVVFIGGQKSYDGGESMSLKAALGTVAVTKGIMGQRRVESWGVRISGLTEDSLGNTRIVGIAYAAEEGKNSHQIGVSVTDQEFPPKLRPFSNGHNLPNYPYGVAGIYTEVMMGATRQKGSDMHTGTLEAHDPAFAGGRLEYWDLNSIQNGFSLSSTATHRTVCYAGKASRSWTLKVPRMLAPSQ